MFARTLGVPIDPVAAARHIVAAAASDTQRTIGLSRAQACEARNSRRECDFRRLEAVDGGARIG